MNAETTPASNEGRLQSNGYEPRPILPGPAGVPQSSGCPAGCEYDPWRNRTIHECGVGTPLAELPPADKFQRGGRDKGWPERDHIGLGILRRMRATA